MPEKKLKKHQKEVLSAVRELGGNATTRQIAEKVNRSVNGVSQTLGALWRFVHCLGGKGGEANWKLWEGA